MSENLLNDWIAIQKCFSGLRSSKVDFATDKFWGLTIEGKARKFVAPSTRAEVISLAAAIMKPRQDNKRLREQINFVVFGVV